MRIQIDNIVAFGEHFNDPHNPENPINNYFLVDVPAGKKIIEGSVWLVEAMTTGAVSWWRFDGGAIDAFTVPFSGTAMMMVSGTERRFCSGDLPIGEYYFNGHFILGDE